MLYIKTVKKQNIPAGLEQENLYTFECDAPECDKTVSWVHSGLYMTNQFMIDHLKSKQWLVSTKGGTGNFKYFCRHTCHAAYLVHKKRELDRYGSV